LAKKTRKKFYLALIKIKWGINPHLK